MARPRSRPASSFTTSSSAPLSATSTADSASAAVKSVEKRSKIASGAVCVTPRKLPGEHQRRAELAQRAAPGERQPRCRATGSASGIATRANVRASEAPSVRDASIRSRSRLAKAACAWRT